MLNNLPFDADGIARTVDMQLDAVFLALKRYFMR